ncbi:hypothetical protein GGTG_07812 [Gaeumannomyces tritici R3-111a-1]|uniref:Methyltransferase domain-containing protein n=1 Tax=Gaeumannomyces tritici (strain R3-111a-1) TaxID=644352 RepID=J3P2R8_GAET3|nr:hypothetical protein GGTG_07812 [Gaeumannomyces tritici R3-111a-1]EJT73960.1 hypothetical protein GGTG_07812 [Gaeumannomyces tritici R3-111a-1]
MASLGGNILPPDVGVKLIFSTLGLVLCTTLGLSRFINNKTEDETPGLVRAFLLFFYSCFVKPHQAGDKGTQQDALESFYKKQAGVYDVTRKALLQGREDMLALAAAQLNHKAAMQQPTRGKGKSPEKRIWVDIGGGTGWNIEAMNRFVKVPEYFSSVYLVDFSPSLCEVATRRFARLGWTNVKVVCEDARRFRLEDHERSSRGSNPYGADLLTMSYSLSMIPDFYSVIDSLRALLAPDGFIGVVDFYVQSKADFSFRNYTGGLLGRHTGYPSRTFWRAWFDLDKVNLEPARRDYLEYLFGTVLSVNFRNRALGSIPYHIWVGRQKPVRLGESSEVTNVPDGIPCADVAVSPKAHQVAIRNRDAGLPLPSFFYQNHPWRIYYDDQEQKHLQFGDEYIYAFTWEDTRVDERLLKLTSDDVVLAITSAGDNVLSYALQSPAKIHAVDLNPNQNHLLELKLASYSALPYEDFWKIFGEGKHQDFRALLISKLSPHLSSRAFQYWLAKSHVFTSRRGRGLYDTGGSKHAIRVFRWVSHAFGCRSAVRALLEAKTLNEQREIWASRIRPALLSRLVSGLVVSSETFLWSALGVPKHQLAMLVADHAESEAVRSGRAADTRAGAVWQFMADTLDPVARETHIADDNPYYRVTLAGRFSPRCHPDYLAPRAHARLSRPGALAGVRLHTDELDVVLGGLAPGSLTVAVVMDSMDWFDPVADRAAAAAQVSRLNRALRPGGRVLLRSAGLKPWYVAEFAALGFTPRRVGARRGGSGGSGGEADCIDRVNMYASCWVMQKTGNLPPPTPTMEVAGGASVAGLSLP